MCSDTENPSPHPRHDRHRPVQDFVEAVLVRPKMYTIDGSLEEVAAFLQGFYSGMVAHNAHSAAEDKAQNWFNFCEWAAHSVEGTTGSSWYHLFQALRQQYHDDSDALDRLLDLYIDFRRQHIENV